MSNAELSKSPNNPPARQKSYENEFYGLFGLVTFTTGVYLEFGVGWACIGLGLTVTLIAAIGALRA